MPVRNLARGLMAALLVALAVQSSSAQSPIVRAAMRDKLTNSQGLLAALVQADFDAILRYTDRMSWISQNEIASWQVSARPEYVKQATVFLDALQGMREAGRKRDLAAATTEYTTLVSSCVQCHTTLRESLRASLLPPAAGTPRAGVKD